jgi:hypothetical protein
MTALTAEPSTVRWWVESWDPGYGASTEEQAGLRTSTVEVALDVEVPEADWRPIQPRPAAPIWSSVLFVDGVRRIDAIGWVAGGDNPDGDNPDGAPIMGLFASYAAGVVCCRPDGARLLAAQARRGLFTTAPHAAEVVTGAGAYRGVYVPAGAASTTPAQQLSQAVVARMRGVEAEVSESARAGLGAYPGEDLLVVDGPLHGRTHLPRTLGYVKTHSTDYLPPPLHRMAGTLAPGSRTPVFGLFDSWRRYSWYLKLPAGSGAPWAGVVRVECAADLPMAEVVALADGSQPMLCRHASTEYKDARAPQNLYPIAGLERQLRRRLGDQALLYRSIRRAAG